MEAPCCFEMLRRAPAPHLAGVVRGLTGYRETCPGRFLQREAAPLTVPLIISLGSPFLIGLGRPPGPSDAQPSFASGLFPGPVHILSDGAAACVQIDLTPLGAVRVFGGALRHLTACMADIEDLFGPDVRRLRERMGATLCWQRRFDLAEDFVAARLRHDPSPGVAFAWRSLVGSGGTLRVAELAAEIGWSRQHLSARVQGELGLAPKTLARLLRFHRACALARAGTEGGWAAVAAAAGFSDQAHLAREFATLAGEAPTAWARRVAGLDGRLHAFVSSGEA